MPDATFERLAQAAGADLDRPRSPEEAHARRQRDARFRELAERVDRLSDPDNLSADPNELDEALRELNGLLGVEPHDE